MVGVFSGSGSFSRAASVVTAITVLGFLFVSNAFAGVSVIAGSDHSRPNTDSHIQTSLNNPHGVAVLPNGAVLITDSWNHRVLKVTANGETVSLFAGTDHWGAGVVPGDPTKTRLNSPGGVAVLPDGGVLIAATWNNRVWKVTADGESVSLFAGTGQQGAGAVPGDPTKTQLSNPDGVAVLPDGAVLITDSLNHRVLKITANGETVSLFAGTDHRGAGVVPGDPTKTALNFPGGVAVLPDGGVLITDTWNHRVLKVTTNGETVSLFAGTGHGGHGVVPGDPTKTALAQPIGVTVLPDGAVLIIDSLNHRVLKVTADGETVSLFAGTGHRGAGVVPGDPTKTELNFPSGVAVLPDGGVLITDRQNSRVLFIGVDEEDVRFAGLVNEAQGALKSGKIEKFKKTLEVLNRDVEIPRFLKEQHALSDPRIIGQKRVNGPGFEKSVSLEACRLSSLPPEVRELIRKFAYQNINPMTTWRARIAVKTVNDMYERYVQAQLQMQFRPKQQFPPPPQFPLQSLPQPHPQQQRSRPLQQQTEQEPRGRHIQQQFEQQQCRQNLQHQQRLANLRQFETNFQQQIAQLQQFQPQQQQQQQIAQPPQMFQPAQFPQMLQTPFQPLQRRQIVPNNTNDNGGPGGMKRLPEGHPGEDNEHRTKKRPKNQ